MNRAGIWGNRARIGQIVLSLSNSYISRNRFDSTTGKQARLTDTDFSTDFGTGCSYWQCFLCRLDRKGLQVNTGMTVHYMRILHH